MRESGPNPDIEQNATERKGSSARLMLSIEVLLKSTSGKLEVHGLEHIRELPRNKKIIIATSHISDIDIPLAVKAVGHDLDLAIANESIHHSFIEEWNTNIGLHVAGKSNFIPVDYKKTGKTKKPMMFNPDNFKTMAEAMDQGKTVLTAAHNPSYHWQLEEGGYGAVYLAELTDAVIVPVGVNLKSEGPVGMYDGQVKTMKQRPDAEVKIGEPIELKKIEGIEDLAKIIGKRKAGEKLTKEEIDRLGQLQDQLKEQSDVVMRKIAELVPEEKRGVYKAE